MPTRRGRRRGLLYRHLGDELGTEVGHFSGPGYSSSRFSCLLFLVIGLLFVTTNGTTTTLVYIRLFPR